MRIPPRWILVVSVATGAAIMGDSLLYAVLPVIWEDLGLTAGMVGIILSINRFVRMVTNPIAGWVAGRIGVRLPFMLAVIVAAGSTLAYGIGLGVAGFLVARCLWGLCWSFLRLGGQLAAIESGVDGRRGFYLGFFSGITRAGSFIAVVIGGFLTDIISFEVTIYLFTAIGALAGLWTFREWRKQPEFIPPEKDHGVAQYQEPPAPQARAWWMAVGTLFSLTFLHGLAISGLVTATLGYLIADRYADGVDLAFVTIGVASFTGLLLGSRFLADAIWAPVAGHSSDRWGRLPFFIIMATIQVVALAFLGAFDLLIWTILGALLLFFAATAVQVSMDAVAGDLAVHGNRATVMSWYATSHDVGAAIGPIIGYSIGISIGLATVYPATAGIFAIVALVFVIVQRKVRSIAAR
ncbi:MAG: MFS transporter [Sphaerobacteraceae bacterium]|nr:MAG: MFS transporter [Sphaerobacteraceae bacterium]